MIKANELRIGNLVHDTEGKVNKITFQALKYLVIYDGAHQVKPIKITEEWLVNLGFTKINSKRFQYEYEHDALSNNLYGSTGCYYMSNITPEIASVHQLQNLYFALTGQELEVKP